MSNKSPFHCYGVKYKCYAASDYYRCNWCGYYLCVTHNIIYGQSIEYGRHYIDSPPGLCVIKEPNMICFNCWIGDL